MHRPIAMGFVFLGLAAAAFARAEAAGSGRPGPAAEEAAEKALLRMPDVDLADAARRGDLKTIALVLAGDPDVLRRELLLFDGRRSPLAAAAEAGQVEALRVLLRAAGAGLDNDDLLWVIEPASEGRIGPVRTYVQAGGDVNLPGNSFTALHRAACAGRLEIVELLLQAGADVNLGPNNWTPLHGAAESGHRAVVQRLLDAGAKMDVARPWGWRPIHSALWFGHTESARLLLERGSKMDLLVAIGLGRTDEALKLLETPLPEESAGPPEPPPAFWAARCGQLDLLKRLVRDKAALCEELPVKFHSLKGATLLHVAAGAGHADVVRWLIEQGAPVDRASGTIGWFNGCTPLHFAAESGKIEAAKALLAAGASIEGAAHDSGSTARPAKASRTPLLAAVRENQREMVEFLLDRGADIEAASSPYVTALSLAAEEGHVELCKLLVKRGAKLTGKPGTITPLAAAVSSGPELLEFLIAQGADASGKAGEGHLPLLLASWKNPACVEVLLRHGAKPDDPDILAEALEAGEAKSVRLLLEAGTRLNADDPAPMLRDAGDLGDVELMKKLLATGTALRDPQQDEFSRHLLSRALEGAVANGHKDLVRFLIARGCRPDERLDGEPALVLAAGRGCKLVVLALLEAGADPKATGLSRRTALVAAAEGGWAGTLRVLLRHVQRPARATKGPTWRWPGSCWTWGRTPTGPTPTARRRSMGRSHRTVSTWPA